MNKRTLTTINLILVICMCRLLVQGQSIYFDIGALPSISFHDNSRIDSHHEEFGFRPSFYLGYKTKKLGIEISFRSMHWSGQIGQDDLEDKEIVARQQRLYDLLIYKGINWSNKIYFNIGFGPSYRGVPGNDGRPAVTIYNYPIVFGGVEYHPFITTYTYSDLGFVLDLNASIKIINDMHIGGRYRVNRFFAHDKYTSWAEFFIRVNIFK